MSRRRSLKIPITLGVTMIVVLVILIVGWVMLAVIGAMRAEGMAPFYWTLLPLGTAAIVAVLVGVVAYLVISIRAVKLNRQQSNFIDSVTHELKSPIASLKLYLQTLSRRQIEPEEQAVFHEKMLDDVERLDHLTSQILDAGRIESGRVVGRVESFRLDETLRKAARIVCHNFSVPESTIAMDLHPFRICARRAEMEIIFRNLLDNAVKYGGDPPHVDLTMHSGEKCVTVYVTDNGGGIPPRLRKQVFRRFFRGGEELQRRRPGTGLGLYIVQTLVKRLGGKVRNYDRAEGNGTVFEVRLPENVRP